MKSSETKHSAKITAKFRATKPPALLVVALPKKFFTFKEIKLAMPKLLYKSSA
jgi:hypothetical protein